jgi:hypothetical protein
MPVPQKERQKENSLSSPLESIYSSHLTSLSPNSLEVSMRADIIDTSKQKAVTSPGVVGI